VALEVGQLAERGGFPHDNQPAPVRRNQHLIVRPARPAHPRHDHCRDGSPVLGYPDAPAPVIFCRTRPRAVARPAPQRGRRWAEQAMCGCGPRPSAALHRAGRPHRQEQRQSAPPWHTVRRDSARTRRHEPDSCRKVK